MLTPGRTWAIAPAEHERRKNETFDRCWQYDRDHGVIAVGWDLGRAPEGRDDLRALWDACASEEWSRSHYGMLERFWFDILPGDWVVARVGRSQVVGVGTVEGEAFYRTGTSAWGPHMRRVHWEHAVSRTDAVPLRERAFPLLTVCRLSEDSVADINRRLDRIGWGGRA